jgi:hypothetical protein
MWKSILLAAGYSVALTDSAYAYLDPGTGTILLQGLIAAAATGMFFMRSTIRSLYDHITGKKKPEPELSDSEY